MNDRSPQVSDIMRLAPVIPVITIESAAHAVPMAEALVAGGLFALEVTLRTPEALPAIEAIAAAVPMAVVGAGTVTQPAQFAQARNAGARFAVSPGSTETLLDAAASAGLPYLPGVATASEVMALLERKITHMKFFPAEASGGTAALKGWSAPLPEARFCPTGGIGPNNAATYLGLPNVLCVGGSWVVPGDAIAAGKWERLTELARAAARLGPDHRS